MTAQEALVHNPDHAGLWRRVLLPDGAVNAAAWHDAIANDRLVGTCKPCGGYLRPLTPYRVDRVEWFPAECVKCGNEISSKGPAPAKKSKRKGPA